MAAIAEIEDGGMAIGEFFEIIVMRKSVAAEAVDEDYSGFRASRAEPEAVEHIFFPCEDANGAAGLGDWHRKNLAHSGMSPRAEEARRATGFGCYLPLADISKATSFSTSSVP